MERYVHLPGLVASTFGCSRSEASRVIVSGGFTVVQDGSPHTIRALDVPANRVRGQVAMFGQRGARRMPL
jgi:hypothetical protein